MFSEDEFVALRHNLPWRIISIIRRRFSSGVGDAMVTELIIMLGSKLDDCEAAGGSASDFVVP
jgi:hypothetical protein